MAGGLHLQPRSTHLQAIRTTSAQPAGLKQMEKYEARTQHTDKGIHLQKGTGGHRWAR